MVRSSHKVDRPPGLRRSGLYFIAADLAGRVPLWAVSREFAQTGGGLAYAVDDYTRSVSATGDLVDVEKVAGVTPSTRGAPEARTCRP